MRIRKQIVFGMAAIVASWCMPCVASAYVPNDPLVSKQHYLAGAEVPAAWDYARCNGKVTVAVVDSGVYGGHYDLKDNVIAEVACDTVGKTLGSAVDTSASGHGTMVAGIVGARAGNSMGLAGVSYNARILPINVFQRDAGTGEDLADAEHVAEAYRYLLDSARVDANGDGAVGTVAEEYNVRVVNLSVGGPLEGGSAAQAEAFSNIRRAYDEGILTVCAAGNSLAGDGSDLPMAFWPGGADTDDTVVNVTAVDQSGVRSDIANYGSGVDLSAPGTEMQTLSHADPLGFGRIERGTSLAAPVVSGVAALMFAANPSLQPADVQRILYETADPLGNANEYGHGMVNALEAVVEALPQKAPGIGVAKKASGFSFRTVTSGRYGGTVKLVKPTSAKKKAYTVPASVKIAGRPYAVTAVAVRAFASCKKATKLTVGANVKSIGASAFKGCKKLKTLTVKSKKLTKAGVKSCLKGSAVTTIKVPASCKAKYKKLFTKKNCGKKVAVKT